MERNVAQGGDARAPRLVDLELVVVAFVRQPEGNKLSGHPPLVEALIQWVRRADLRRRDFSPLLTVRAGLRRLCEELGRRTLGRVVRAAEQFLTAAADLETGPPWLPVTRDPQMPSLCEFRPRLWVLGLAQRAALEAVAGATEPAQVRRAAAHAAALLGDDLRAIDRYAYDLCLAPGRGHAHADDGLRRTVIDGLAALGWTHESIARVASALTGQESKPSERRREARRVARVLASRGRLVPALKALREWMQAPAPGDCVPYVDDGNWIAGYQRLDAAIARCENLRPSRRPSVRAFRNNFLKSAGIS
jgi:hypothetical protein